MLKFIQPGGMLRYALNELGLSANALSAMDRPRDGMNRDVRVARPTALCVADHV